VYQVDEAFGLVSSMKVSSWDSEADSFVFCVLNEHLNRVTLSDALKLGSGFAAR
jgi:hypothetical protein